MDNDWRNKTLAGVDYSSTSSQSPLNSEVPQGYDYETGQLNGVKTKRNPFGVLFLILFKVAKMLLMVVLFCGYIVPRIVTDIPASLDDSKLAQMILSGDIMLPLTLFGIAIVSWVAAIFTGVSKQIRKSIIGLFVGPLLIYLSGFLIDYCMQHM